MDADGASLGSFEYTVDGPVAMAFLTGALGSEPVVSERQGDSSCTATASAAVWADGAVVLIFGFPQSAPSMLLVDCDVVDGTYEDIDDGDFGMTANAYWGAQAAATDGTTTDLTARTYFQSAC